MIVLACDLGGTRMKVGVVQDSRVLAQATEAADSKAGVTVCLPVLKSSWLRLLNELRLGLRDCAGLAIGFPSLVDVASGHVLAHYGKYPDALGFDFRAWAKREFGLPIAIENDARMALAGEWQHGAGRGCDDLVMITLGTGLGTAALIEGRLVRGRHGQAGVLGGHLTVEHRGRDCKCGNVGCAEAEASTATLREVASGLPEWHSSVLRELNTVDYAAIFKHASLSDPCARRVRDQSLRVWGALGVNLIHAYDPEMVIVGGGIMKSAQVVLPALSEYIGRHAHTPWGKVRVVAGDLGDAAALVAGNWLVREQYPNLK